MKPAEFEHPGAGWFGQNIEALRAIRTRGDALSEATKTG
jgi:hypothetical protein